MNIRARTALLRRRSFPPDHVDELWNKIPRRFHGGLLRYMKDHLEAGGFLMSIFKNDLQNAVMRADSEGLPALKDIVQYVQSCAPSPCWGTPEAVTEWLTAESRREYSE